MNSCTMSICYNVWYPIMKLGWLIWLISCVNLSGYWVPRLNTVSRSVWVGSCFQITVVFELMTQQSRLALLMWADIINPLRAWTEQEVRKEDFIPFFLPHWAGHPVSFSPALGLGLTLVPFLFSGLRAPPELYHYVSWVSSLQMADYRTSQLP